MKAPRRSFRGGIGPALVFGEMMAAFGAEGFVPAQPRFAEPPYEGPVNHRGKPFTAADSTAIERARLKRERKAAIKARHRA